MDQKLDTTNKQANKKQIEPWLAGRKEQPMSNESQES